MVLRRTNQINIQILSLSFCRTAENSTFITSPSANKTHFKWIINGNKKFHFVFQISLADTILLQTEKKQCVFMCPGLFCQNPQFHFVLSEVDRNPGKTQNTCSFVLALMQKYQRRKGIHLAIGMHIYPVQSHIDMHDVSYWSATDLLRWTGSKQNSPAFYT